MKSYTKFSCLLFTFLISVKLFAQQNPPQPDDGMDIFLLTIATIFGGILVGAAIIGAFAAAIIIGLIALFCGVGLVSISFLAGIYKRSFSSGFKTFIALSLTGMGAITGAVTGIVLKSFFLQHLSAPLLLCLGTAAGAIGGLLLSFVAFKLIIAGLASLTKKIGGKASYLSSTTSATSSTRM